ncbi:hypothetical protein T11_6829 [Trichinella zimbabwensis]|uniref:Uncharacterized protein n=1 Tax=Trichinella zimbabwensis TaxID=268475 RepID=A0A0V1GXX7_9BILA|nr:hypothetical protein T11_6829 [Trichinella zimbabwensis]
MGTRTNEMPVGNNLGIFSNFKSRAHSLILSSHWFSEMLNFTNMSKSASSSVCVILSAGVQRYNNYGMQVAKSSIRMLQIK